ncbi:uncharacterized protein LOC122394167 [Amphibalanus amphitrite]|uniref:uncharacterized protein LOC122394167 n=1 Tax=Amphibalanus amphitrite TaxID=1232801 RepID=UPI001C90D64E|nr:uncharacterized protein LOC122394167 [Amphibalanus amphitrite]
MIFIPETSSMASAAAPEPAVNCSSHASDGGPADVAFTVGVITVAAAFCVISVVSLCHCVRHVLAGSATKDAPETLFYTEDEVEMAELRHFPLPHAGQVPRVRTPPSPSPSPMKFLLSPPEARLSQTRLMSSRAAHQAAAAARRDPARLTCSLPSLHTLSGSRAAHGAVEHYVEMALVSAMTASSNHELPGLAPEEPDASEPLLPQPAPPSIPPRDSSSRGRRRLQRRRYPRTPLPRAALAPAASAPPGPSHGSVDTDYQSAYAPSHITDSDEQTTTKGASAAVAPRSAASKVSTTRKGARPGGRGAAGPTGPKREGSELILVSRRALERLLRRPLTAAELHTGGPDRSVDQGTERKRHRTDDKGKNWELNGKQEQDRNRNHELNRSQKDKNGNQEQDDTMHISGLQPLEDSAVANEDSIPIRYETAGVLADTEDNLADSVGTLGETRNTGDTISIALEGTETLADTTETLRGTSETLESVFEGTPVTLGETTAAAEGSETGWIPEPPSPEWDPSTEPRHRPATLLLAVATRSHSVV